MQVGRVVGRSTRAPIGIAKSYELHCERMRTNLKVSCSNFRPFCGGMLSVVQARGQRQCLILSVFPAEKAQHLKMVIVPLARRRGAFAWLELRLMVLSLLQGSLEIKIDGQQFGY